MTERKPLGRPRPNKPLRPDDSELPTDLSPFLIARGGPFYALQMRLGLVNPKTLKPVVRAVMFIVVTWGIPLILCLIAGTAYGPLETRPFLLDPGAWARFFVAIGLLILAETQIEEQLRQGVNQFFAGPLLSEQALADAKIAVAKALRRRNSVLADTISLIVAWSASMLLAFGMRDQTELSWVAGAGTGFSTAGWWTIIISNTLFWFLVARALWRHMIWSMLLFDISKLEMRLVVSHPDGHAGIGFISRYPNAYMLFTVAVSCVVAAAVAHQVLHGTVTISAISTIMGGWLSFILVYYGLPMAGFMIRISRLKKDSLLAASDCATGFQRKAERETLGVNICLPQDDFKDEERADPAKFYQAASKVSPMLATRTTLLPVAAAALLPFATVAVTQLPLKELLPVLKRLLLL